MKKLSIHGLLLFLLVILYTSIISGSSTSNITPSISGNIHISLLTYSPGNDLYSLFGHSAIRVVNEKLQTDMVYNYGTFQFEVPKFYSQFIKGNLQYSLSKSSADYVWQKTQFENRSIYETPLSLSDSEKNEIIDILETNLLPENKYYTYDFLFDNCATKILDILKDSKKDSLLLHIQALPVSTFRKLLQPYTKHRPWVYLGIDLALGCNADKTAILTEPAFLPDFLHLFVKNFYTLKGNEKQSLGNQDILVINSVPREDELRLTPSMIFFALAFLFLMSVFIKSYIQPIFIYIGNLIFFLSGLTSVILIYLWIGTEHYVFSCNADLLWLNPLFLVVLYLRKKEMLALRIFLIVGFILTVAGAIFAYFIERNIELLSLATLLSIHYFSLLREYKNFLTN